MHDLRTRTKHSTISQFSSASRAKQYRRRNISPIKQTSVKFIIMSSSHRILACAMLLFLQASNGFLRVTSLEPLHQQHQKPTSCSQLSMAWTLPNQPTFRPSWYQDCGNPTRRAVVYDDFEDDDEFYVSNFQRVWGSSLSSTVDTTEPSVSEQEVLPRGARIGRAARRALKGLRNTLRP